MEFIFFLSLGFVVYIYLGYPLVLFASRMFFYAPVKKEDIAPFVTVFISAYNEAGNIEAKVLNLLESDYPKEKMEIMVGSDGSTDETYQIIKRLAQEKNIRYTVSFNRAGKCSMLNKMSREARGDIYIFSDARQKFEKDAVRNLLRPFADSNVGCVSGELIFRDRSTGPGRGIGLYWAYEKWLRRMESETGSMLGATGAIYAVRKEHFHYLPDVILDDVYTPMNAVMAGKRAVFEPEARAYDDISETSEKEYSRKVRTLAGNFQLFALNPEYFNPLKSRVAFRMFSHKLLRLLAPYFLGLLFLSNIFIASKGTFFLLALVIQAMLYIAAFLGGKVNSFDASGKMRLLSVPYEFCLMNWAAVAAFFKFQKGELSVLWEK